MVYELVPADSSSTVIYLNPSPIKIESWVLADTDGIDNNMNTYMSSALCRLGQIKLGVLKCVKRTTIKRIQWVNNKINSITLL